MTHQIIITQSQKDSTVSFSLSGKSDELIEVISRLKQTEPTTELQRRGKENTLQLLQVAYDWEQLFENIARQLAFDDN